MAFFWGEDDAVAKPNSGRRSNRPQDNGAIFNSGSSISNQPPERQPSPITNPRAYIPNSFQEPSQSQIRQEWQQEQTLREELWQRQQPQQQPHTMQPQRRGPGSGGPRRPSPYRDEAAAVGSFGQSGQGGQGIGLAPPEGADRRFDTRVLAAQESRSYLREKLWAKFGGTSEPAAVGLIPAFDAAFDEAWAEMRDVKAAQADAEAEVKARAEEEGVVGASSSLSSAGDGGGGGMPRTPFDADVAAEMEKLETELRAELRSGPPPQQQQQQQQQQQNNWRQEQLQQQPTAAAPPRISVRPPAVSEPPFGSRSTDDSRQWQQQPSYSPHTQHYQSPAVQPLSSRQPSPFDDAGTRGGHGGEFPSGTSHHPQQHQTPQASAPQSNSQAPWMQQQQVVPPTTGRRGQFSSRGGSTFSLG